MFLMNGLDLEYQWLYQLDVILISVVQARGWRRCRKQFVNGVNKRSENDRKLKCDHYYKGPTFTLVPKIYFIKCASKSIEIHTIKSKRPIYSKWNEYKRAASIRAEKRKEKKRRTKWSNR